MMAQHKKILFLASLPETQEFQKHEANLSNCCQKLKGLGVIIGEGITENSLRNILEFDLVIVLAHLDEENNELILKDSRMGIDTFVNAIPENFNGIIDFSSCHSAQWINCIKAKSPNCHVMGAMGQTTLPFRLYIYPFVIQMYLSNDNIAYNNAYTMVMDFVKKEMEARQKGTNVEAGNAEGATKLGKQMSSIYAPAKVARNQAFMVQLFLHDDSISVNKITIQAKKFDPNTRCVETQTLPIKIRKGERIAVRLETFSSQPENIRIDRPVKETIWNGQSVKFQFNVIVSDSFAESSFIGNLLIEVNHEPIGESSFTIQVSEKKDDAPATISIERRDRNIDGEQGRANLKSQLQNNLHTLLDQWDHAQDDASRAKLRKAIDTCQLCIHLIESPIESEALVRPKKVFVSSTCEDFMKPFRSIARNVITSLKMEPEMCDDWPQTGCNPTHVCCQKVLDSDIYVGVFGGRYGYIEPSLKSSMTQVEYLTALSAKKKMLLFVINPLNSTDEPDAVKSKQESFIADMKKTRILRTFSDVSELSELIKNDLLELITKA